MPRKKQLRLPVCCTCLTSESNPDNGYCANGHDDWVELRDFTVLRNGGDTPQAIRELEREIRNRNPGVWNDWMTQFGVLKRLAKKLDVKLHDLLRVYTLTKHKKKKEAADGT